jgi:hypothetical protein
LGHNDDIVLLQRDSLDAHCLGDEAGKVIARFDFRDALNADYSDCDFLPPSTRF